MTTMRAILAAVDEKVTALENGEEAIAPSVNGKELVSL